MSCANSYPSRMTSGIMTYEATRRVETSVRTFTIVEQLDEAGPSRVSTIAADLEMTKGIVHNHLSTLRELGYVVKVDDHYQLSAKVLALGHRVRTNSPLYRAAHSPLKRYAKRVDTGVVLYSQTDTDAVVVDTHGLDASSDIAVGATLSLTDSLAGVVMLLAADDREPATATTYDLDDIASQRDADGVAVGRLSSTRSRSACSVAITTETGDCLGSLAVLLPANDAEKRDEIQQSIAPLADQIERRLAGDESTERSFATEKHAWIDR